MFIGIDGEKRGWVAVTLNAEGFVDAACFRDFASLMSAYVDARVIAVDMPIGLCDHESRIADAAARAQLRGRASSIFNAPPRCALEAPDYATASRASFETLGKKLSKQSYMLFEKIREVDAFIGDRRIHEVHPEVSFSLMKPGPLPHSKKSWGGLMERLALLRQAGIELPASLGDVDRVGVDDLVDAAAAAWSARRIAEGTAQSFPSETTQLDASGRSIAIWG